MKRLKKLTLGACIAALCAGAAMAQDARFVGWSYSEASSKPFIENEAAKVDGVDVELIGFPWNQMVQNLILRHRSGQTTEVAQVQDRWMPMLVGMGALADLNDTLGADALADTVEPGLLAMGQSNGGQYGVPWTAASIALVGNRELMEAAGVTELPATMEDFHAALKKIKAADPEAVPFGLSTTNPNLIQVESQVFFWQFGARFFRDGAVAVDSAEAREALAFLVQLVDEGLVAKGNDRNATRALYGQGKVGFYFDPPVARGIARNLSGEGEAFDENVVVMPTPTTGNGEPPRSVVWAHFLTSLTAGSPDTEAAGKVIEHFAMKPDVQLRYWNELGLFPTTKAALAELSDDAYVANWIELARDALPDEPAAFENSAQLTQIIGEEIEAALLGIKSVDEAITDMADRLEGAL